MTILTDGQRRPSSTWHRLSEIDPESRTATCAQCGPTKLAWKKHRLQWVCRTARKKDDRRRPSPKHVRLGMTPADVLALRNAQGNVCAICAMELTSGRQVHLDHDHASGRVRALLCRDCNVGLGCMRDKPELMRAAADYIERYRDAA